MVQVIPQWFVSGDDLAAVAPNVFQKPIQYMEDHCICQRMTEDYYDEKGDGEEENSLLAIKKNNGGRLEYYEEPEEKKEQEEQEAYRSPSFALADDLHQAEEEKEDWEAKIRSINYTMKTTTITATTTDETADDNQSTFSGIMTSCSEATAEATNVAKETTRSVISKSQEGVREVHTKLSTGRSPLQIVPAWIITGDDVAQIAPESCQSPIRYMEDHCICQRMPDTSDDYHHQQYHSKQQKFHTSMMSDEEMKTNSNDDGDDDNYNNDHTSTTQERHLFSMLNNLNARAPLEPPNPKRPGESHFIEDDMMELLETV
ncbi:unnamed protein product [Cylindrotheca closterium]|uniref:Uncharacterized protein n=1 Tax=Cylindrotheca closterium TaxID=2856 RepID=A0AAD2JPR8_9STRA|nr:unnamed protein product [Cylindrotheca closterium]